MRGATFDPFTEHAPWIELDPRTMRFAGSSGCRRFGGSYDTDDDELSFDSLSVARTPCGTAGTETAFLRALGATRRYQLFGRVLELMDDDRKLLIRLEARAR